MESVYTEYIEKWCLDNAPLSLGKESKEEIISQMLGCYLNRHRIQTVELTKDVIDSQSGSDEVNSIPASVIMCAGKYFMIAPNVWRLAVGDSETYKAYESFLANKMEV